MSNKFYNPTTKEICTKMELFHLGIGTDNIQFLVDRSNFYLLTENIPDVDNYHVAVIDGEPIANSETSFIQNYKEELLPIDKLKEIKLTEINTQYESAIAELTRGYPQTEISSWSKQEEEANSWTKDNNAVVPFLTNLSIKRNVPMEILCQKVLDKALLYAIKSGDITGQRQYMEDLLDKIIDDPNAILQIIVEYEV